MGTFSARSLRKHLPLLSHFWTSWLVCELSSFRSWCFDRRSIFHSKVRVCFLSWDRFCCHRSSSFIVFFAETNENVERCPGEDGLGGWLLWVSSGRPSSAGEWPRAGLSAAGAAHQNALEIHHQRCFIRGQRTIFNKCHMRSSWSSESLEIEQRRFQQP